MRRLVSMLGSLALCACLSAIEADVDVTGTPCPVAAPGVACNITVAIAPYVTNGGPFGGFQSTSGTSYQSDITITFSQPVKAVTVTALDPDYAGNVLIAYSGATELRRAPFVGDSMPGAFTQSTATVRPGNITHVVLRPDPADYVAYTNLIFEY